ncbi:MAG: aminoglycoside phosphotransferase family protein [Verrucomicrobia bacterium]|nr:aminoglycoside phosphotransferase family protein [Verrucomicrobiota bacterium]
MNSLLPPGSSRFLVRPLTGSTGFLSRIFVATRKGDPRRYILKVGSNLPDRKRWASQLRVFARERAAYRLLAPLQGRLCPRMFAGAVAVRGSDGLLLLEEIRGGRNRDQLRGLTWPELASATRSIARIHARFWNSSTLNKSPDLPRHHYMRAHEIRSHLPRFLRWAKPSARERVLFRDLSQRVPAVLSRFRKQPITLVHGDLRSDNIFYGRNSLRFIDWGLALAGNAAFDVARLAGGSPRKPLTLLQHVDLLNLWHAELLRNGVRNYPLHQAWQDYRDAVLLTLTIPVTNAPTLATFSPRGRRMAKLITKRFAFSAREVGVV